MIPIGTITWLADKLMQHRRGNKAALREKWDRVADYFDEIANCLEKMIPRFKRKEIPRTEGHQLEVLIREFGRVVESIYSKKVDQDKEQVHQMLSELYKTAERASNLDVMFAIAGDNERDVWDMLSMPRDEWIIQTERMVGRYRGLAAALRASTPKSS